MTDWNSAGIVDIRCEDAKGKPLEVGIGVTKTQVAVKFDDFIVFIDPLSTLTLTECLVAATEVLSLEKVAEALEGGEKDVH